MADNQKFIQTQPFTLAGSGVSIGDTSITLTSLRKISPDGVTQGGTIAMTDLGSKCWMTIEPNSSDREEQISFTGITQNANGTATLTGVKNVLFNAPYTEISGFQKSHPGGVFAVISNTAGFYDAMSSKSNDETITGKYTFPSSDPNRACIGSDTDTTEATAFVTLGQLSRQAISGASNASETVKGIIELATGTESAAGTSSGGTGARLVPANSNCKNSSAGVGDANKIPVLNTGGKLDASFGGSASTLATLDGSIKVVQDPANATATPTASKIPIANGGGKIANGWINTKFGGTGTDGALDTTSAPVSIDLGGLSYVEKNYTSITVVTNNLTFTNPHANGTHIVLRSQGNVTISATIDVSSLGALGGTGTAHAVGRNGNDSDLIFDNLDHFGLGGNPNNTTTGGLGGGAGVIYSNKYTNSTNYLHRRQILLTCGNGGGAGGGTDDSGGVDINPGGNGGRGGGCLLIECAGAWNFTGTINANAGNGGNGTVRASGATNGGSGGGGGGSGGMVVVLYNTLTANSGTITVAGGIGGNGANGYSDGSTNRGGGGGGSSSGNHITAGGGGGNGGDGGNNGTDGATPAGGGAGGTKGNQSGGRAGGGGGGGGGAIGSYLVAPNTWFF